MPAMMSSSLGQGRHHMELIENETLDDERALYGRHGIRVVGTSFAGAADGESALKECSDVVVEDSFFDLRYPMWHDHGLTVRDSELTENARAAIWYSDHIDIAGSRLHGIKVLRECHDVALHGCDLVSKESGWNLDRVSLDGCTVESEYFMMGTSHISARDCTFRGKYYFQYISNSEFDHIDIETKDAFWHAKNVTVRDSVVSSEYLGWYSDGLTLVSCRIFGSQPLCYCTNLTLVDCEMVDGDLAFEKSQVEATLTVPIPSIKNPASGRIEVPSVGELVMDDPEARGVVVQTNAVTAVMQR